MLGVKGNLTPNPSPKGEGSSEGEKQTLIAQHSSFNIQRSSLTDKKVPNLKIIPQKQPLFRNNSVSLYPIIDRNKVEQEKLELLEKIKFPSDLRQLTIDQLPEVCEELRQDIVKELSVNPGHLASSLGVVELTVALHYVFDTPNDRIVWDVGHQAYGHKILTGRREQFCTNRKLGGIKPFPSPDESEYDTFTCGHASNSISAER